MEVSLIGLFMVFDSRKTDYQLSDLKKIYFGLQRLRRFQITIGNFFQYTCCRFLCVLHLQSNFILILTDASFYTSVWPFVVAFFGFLATVILTIVLINSPSSILQKKMEFRDKILMILSCPRFVRLRRELGRLLMFIEKDGPRFHRHRHRWTVQTQQRKIHQYWLRLLHHPTPIQAI